MQHMVSLVQLGVLRSVRAGGVLHCYYFKPNARYNYPIRVTCFCNSVIGAKKDEANRLDLKLNARNTAVLFAAVTLSEG